MKFDEYLNAIAKSTTDAWKKVDAFTYIYGEDLDIALEIDAPNEDEDEKFFCEAWNEKFPNKQALRYSALLLFRGNLVKVVELVFADSRVYTAIPSNGINGWIDAFDDKIADIVNQGSESYSELKESLGFKISKESINYSNW